MKVKNSKGVYIIDIHQPRKVTQIRPTVTEELSNNLLLVRRMHKLDPDKPDTVYKCILRLMPKEFPLPAAALADVFYVECLRSHNWWWYTVPRLPFALGEAIYGQLGDLPKVFYYGDFTALAQQMNNSIERFEPVAAILLSIWATQPDAD